MPLVHLSHLLLLLWKLSTVFMIPIIIVIYVAVMNSYSGDFTFQQLDQGKNLHKWSVFAVYLAYLLVWNRSNKIVCNYLNKLKYS
ncbi:hypothetical protein [Psychromonas aquimarina]|uniref:hypothetical protein n=1 Tax=Psychromonas aquimarina TaxID=444919 RepID=UPI0003F96F38|nr:hypothetical protein [Psychromonas aquimarina]